MKIKEIRCLNLVNDSSNVLVTLENNTIFVVAVCTLQFLSSLMGERYFVPPDNPYIIVSKLTDEIILAAIQEYIDAKEDSYWLKLYHITASLRIEEINEILDRKEKEYIDLRYV
jgi:hypothetical protein